MRQILDKALVTIFGCLNRVVYAASLGRAVVYRFHGLPGELLTITGPATPAGDTVMACCFPDGDDYIVMAGESETRLSAALRTATAVSLFDQQIPADIVLLTDDTERTALLNRLSFYERYEVTRSREVPIARLTPHHRPEPRRSQAVSRIP